MYNAIIIDDETYVLEYLPQLINWKAYDINIQGLFSSGMKAIEFPNSSKKNVDIVFTDISMPNTDGFDVAEYCYKNYPNAKVIFFSAYSSFTFAQKAFSYEVYDYLVKPITVKALEKVLERLKKQLDSSKEQNIVLSDDFDIISTTKQYICENYKKDITLEDIAHFNQLSPSYFSSLYKRKSGESMITTLNKYRIEQAKKLLQDKHVKISHLHEMVGYQSRGYFFRLFKSICGMTPSEYKNNIDAEKK